MERVITSWSEISLEDLFYAYRKAKADCFFERSLRLAERFIEYEGDIGSNLEHLLEQLHADGAGAVIEASSGSPILFPRKLSVNPKGGVSKSHAYFSDPKRSFDRIVQGTNLTPEFRMIGDFGVEAHILSALWINLIGHKFDAVLSNNALASRVRRYRPDRKSEKLGAYHREAIGSFEPYFAPYRQWRDKGLAAMSKHLKADEAVIGLTLDIGNFYHSIDPAFFAEDEFQKELGLKLTDFEKLFTKQFSDSLVAWSSGCLKRLASLGCDLEDVKTAGIPIGLSIVRVISNCLLFFLDNQIEHNINPIYYGRYVDDIFLVLNDQNKFSSQEELWEWIHARVPCLSPNKSTGHVSLNLPAWAGSTRLRLQAEKQKCFFLAGRSGLDLLDNIAAQVRSVSSERRLMPLPEQLSQTQSAKVLAATDTPDEADNLRRADGLTVRRLGWSILLRSIEALSRDLRPKDWRAERQKFYEFTHEHVIRPDKILEQLDHLPRLFTIAVSLADWKPALRMVRASLNSIHQLKTASEGCSTCINGVQADHIAPEVWQEVEGQIASYFREAMIRGYPVGIKANGSRALHDLLKLLSMTELDLISKSMAAHRTDWARVPYKDFVRYSANSITVSQDTEKKLYGYYVHEEMLRQFLTRADAKESGALCRRKKVPLDAGVEESKLPYLFPTRPYSAHEIALFLPLECVFADDPVQAACDWAEYTRAVRGIWVRSDLAEENLPPSFYAEKEEEADKADGDEQPRVVVVGSSIEPRPIKLGITSFHTSMDSWAMAAAGTPDLSPDRYRNLADMVNQAVGCKVRPDYLLLPELSVPERWLPTISGRLKDAGISLIAGLDYDLHDGDEIDSSAVLVLTDNRLGFPAMLEIRQKKDLPAPGEEEDLFVSHGRSWKISSKSSEKSAGASEKPVYFHNGFYFGVLVCSELQNMGFRSSFQGNVDCMMVLSWNKDLETFSSLIESASFDVHAYIALVNNRAYGDSRVRRPAKQSHARDVCRIRGGVNDQLVVVKIDPEELRAQQSRARRWPKKSDSYKPAPEGFKISKHRKRVPS